MQRTKVKTILEKGIAEQDVCVCGWVRTKRVSKNFAFVVINDGSSQRDIQCVVDADTPAFAKLDHILTGASVRIDGKLKASQGKEQSWEIHTKNLEIFGKSDETYPLQKKGHTLEYLRDISQFRSRTNTLGAIFRIRNAVAAAIHNFFQERGFIWVHTPIITGNDCEGAGELFHITNHSPYGKSAIKDAKDDFFGKPAYLTVSGQLQGEIFAMSHGEIYTFGPTFRAENSNTSRHLAEFWMVEPEVAFNDLKDNMALAEDFFKYVGKQALEKCPHEFSFLENQYKVINQEELHRLFEQKFQHITYTDAVTQLQKSGQKFEYEVKWGIDLQSEHERYLTDTVFKCPTIVTDYPKTIKPFYMKVNSDDKTVAAMDVLVPKVGEIIGGSQREDQLEIILARMNELGLATETLDWYLDLRRFGTTPHAGFGLGLERLVQYLTGMGNIRDVIPFPRTPGNLTF